MKTNPIAVLVKLDDRIPGRLRGGALMALERYLRDHGCEACVFLERRPDDLKSRALMTEEERQKL